MEELKTRQLLELDAANLITNRFSGVKLAVMQNELNNANQVGKGCRYTDKVKLFNVLITQRCMSNARTLTVSMYVNRSTHSEASTRQGSSTTTCGNMPIYWQRGSSESRAPDRCLLPGPLITYVKRG